MHRYLHPMKSILSLLSLALVMSLVPLTHGAEKSKKAEHGDAVAKVRHIVCFKFKAGTTDAQIKAMEREFAALKGKVDGMVSFEHGKNNSPEGLNKDFTHCYVATFKNAKARDAYLPHPAHKEFVAKHLKPIMDDVFVIDFGGK